MHEDDTNWGPIEIRKRRVVVADHKEPVVHQRTGHPERGYDRLMAMLYIKHSQANLVCERDCVKRSTSYIKLYL